MEHCLINGKRCTKCCEVLTINESSSMREWMSYARQVEFDDFKPDDENINKKDMQLYWMVKKITKRKAKKINPHLVSKIKTRQSYFVCKHLNASGCGNSENRP